MTHAADLLGADYQRIESSLAAQSSPLLASPRRGRAFWRDVPTFFDFHDDDGAAVGCGIIGPLWSNLGNPTLLLWQGIAHEMGHAHALQQPTPWSFHAINSALMALSDDERVDHEIRAFLVQHELTEMVTGVRLASRKETARQAALQGAVAAVMSQLLGGDIRKATAFAAECVEGQHMDEIMAFVPSMRTRVARVLRRHDPVAGARATLAAASSARSRHRKINCPASSATSLPTATICTPPLATGCEVAAAINTSAWT